MNGYEFYASIARYIGRHGADGAVADFVDLMPWGTPEQVLEKLDYIRETIGMAGFTPSLCYGGMPYEEAERNIACFVDQVMPTLKEWETEPIGLVG